MEKLWIFLVVGLMSCTENKVQSSNEERTESKVLVSNEEENDAPPFQNKEEVWTITNAYNGDADVTIEWFEGNEKYKEKYQIIGNEPVFAIESTFLMEENESESLIWQCSYTIEQNQVIKHESTGYGKTDLESWDPNFILEQWKMRKPIYLQKLLEQAK